MHQNERGVYVEPILAPGVIDVDGPSESPDAGVVPGKRYRDSSQASSALSSRQMGFLGGPTVDFIGGSQALSAASFIGVVISA